MKDKLLKIIEHYELLTQLKYIHTEYYELDEAILEYYNDTINYYPEVEKCHVNHIAEEIADVMVILKQFQHYFGISDLDIQKNMEYKINRQLERIEKEENVSSRN